MTRLRSHFFSTFALGAALALLAAPVQAADPECVNAISEPPVFSGCQLKMTGLAVNVQFCSPQFDIDGDPIPEAGALKSCTVTLDGAIQAVATVDRPGQLFSISLAGKNPGHVVTAFCSTVEDLQGEVWTSDICFPAKEPKKPHKQ
jgi:hypothetical protein